MILALRHGAEGAGSARRFAIIHVGPYGGEKCSEHTEQAGLRSSVAVLLTESERVHFAIEYGYAMHRHIHPVEVKAC